MMDNPATKVHDMLVIMNTFMCFCVMLENGAFSGLYINPAKREIHVHDGA